MDKDYWENINAAIDKYELNHPQLNIKNPSPRKIVCTNNKKYGWGGYCDDGSLTINNIYTLDHLIVYPYYTEVYLKELPDKKFSSCSFCECEE